MQMNEVNEYVENDDRKFNQKVVSMDSHPKSKH